MTSSSGSSNKPTNKWPVSAFVTTVALASILVVVAVLWLLEPRKHGIYIAVDTLGSVAEWVAGIGTLAAVFAAMFAFAREQRHNREALQNGFERLDVSRRALSLQLDKRDMEQASMIAAWVTCRARGNRGEPLWNELDNRLEQLWTAGQQSMRQLIENSDLTRKPSEEGGPAAPDFKEMLQHFGDHGPRASAWVILTCQNISHQPIFDVRIEIVSSETTDQVACAFSWPIWSPDRPLFEERVLRPDGSDFVVNLAEANSQTRSWRVRIFFTDTASRRWERREEGQLRRVDPSL
jgi:hypothetical protein